jgi:hypothetical protein
MPRVQQIAGNFIRALFVLKSEGLDLVLVSIVVEVVCGFVCDDDQTIYS